LKRERNHRKQPDLTERPITMFAIIAVVLAVIVALTVLSFAVHILFSPWLLVAVAVLAWIKFRPRRSHQ
jgi:ABC-type xylose transport system permease subunit